MKRLCLFAVSIVAAGCSDGPRRAAAVAPDKARAALKQTLDAWKAGQKPDDLTRASPAVTAQDFDWLAGATLTSYELLDDGVAEDANLMVKVKLTVKDRQGKAATKTVRYVVGTDPSLTVFRAME